MPEIEPPSDVASPDASGHRGPSDRTADTAGGVGRSLHAALRDADAILARSLADEADAAATRLRVRNEGITPLPPTGEVAPLLEPGEQLVAIRRSAVITEPESAGRPPRSTGGDLCVTTRRLLLLAIAVRTIELAEIDDVILNGERLLVAMHDSSSFTLDVDGPRRLRVEIAAARAALRR